MHDIPTLSELDRDGALQEAADKAGISRSQLLRRSAFVGGGLIVGGLPVAFSVAQNTAKGDIDILNYALTLEYLEAAFYEEANRKGALSGQLKRFSEIVGEHENAHVDALKQTLGGKAVKKPKFDFKGTTESESTFAATAQVLEDTGVEAYQGQAGNIKSDAVLKAALSIHTVEARHAAALNKIVGKSIVPDGAFAKPASMEEVLPKVKPFLVS